MNYFETVIDIIVRLLLLFVYSDCPLVAYLKIHYADVHPLYCFLYYYCY